MYLPKMKRYKMKSYKFPLSICFRLFFSVFQITSIHICGIVIFSPNVTVHLFNAFICWNRMKANDVAHTWYLFQKCCDTLQNEQSQMPRQRLSSVSFSSVLLHTPFFCPEGFLCIHVLKEVQQVRQVMNNKWDLMKW